MVSLDSIPGVDLNRQNRLILYYFVGLAVLVVVFTVLYNLAMAHVEGVNQSIFASFEFMVQTMTTTGYGQDSDIWSHPAMFLFVALAQITGIGIGFFTLRLIIIPLFNEARVDLDDRLTPKHDHVIICEYRRDSSVLLDELDELGIDYVLISSSFDDAKRLSDAGYSAIHGSPGSAETFQRANIDDARAVIADAGSGNVETILTVRSLRSDLRVIALTDDSDRQSILEASGADTVLSPHGVLGHRLAEKAISTLGADLTDAISLGSDTELLELPIPHGSRLIGRQIRELSIREETGAQIVGAWIDGELQLPPDPSAIVHPNTVLLVTGEHAAIEAFGEITRPARRHAGHDHVVVAGYGEVGQAAAASFAEADIDVTTVDVTDRAGVDVVGDVTQESVLREAGLSAAGAVVIALPEDADALLATVLARSIDADVELLVRVAETDATGKALSAGADYVLSVPRLSARMLARELRGEDVLAPASQIRLVRVPATPFAGQTLADSGIYERTGCRVVALTDDSGTTVTVDPERTFAGDERLTIVGPDEDVQTFLKRYDVRPVENGSGR